MKLLKPSKKQYTGWSLPNKATFKGYKYGRVGLILAMVAIILGFLYWRFPYKTDKSNLKEINTPIFSSNNNVFKLLVIPFNELCDNSNYDVGVVIKNRLNDLSDKNELSVKIKYLDISISNNFEADSADIIMKYNNADMIIYGNYLSNKCSNTTLDEYCINYIIDSKYIFGNLQKQTSQNTFQPSNFHEISKGAYQGNIDFIVYLMSGMKKYATADYSGSFNGLKRIEKHLIPDFLPVIYCMSHSCAEIGKPQQAINYSNIIIQHDTTFWRSYYIRGLSHLILKNLDSCYQDMKDLIEFNTLNESAFDVLSQYYYLREDLDSAIYYFKIGNKDSSDYKLYHRISWAYFKKNDYENAILLSNVLVNGFTPKRDVALLLRALSYAALKDFELAIIDLNQIIKEYPNHFLAYLYRGNIYREQKRYKLAEKDFYTCIELDSTDCEQYFQLARVYHEQNDITMEKKTLGKGFVAGCKEELVDFGKKKYEIRLEP